MTDHVVIPDCQVKAGVDISHLRCIGNYIVANKPDAIINLGDFADMPSLSSYDFGKLDFEGRRYIQDIEFTKYAMMQLMAPLYEHNEWQRKNKHKLYKPRKKFTLGNHEDRIDRAVQNDPKLAGLIKVTDLGYKDHGWEVHKFLDVVEVDGIYYSHYFVSGAMGRPVASAQAMLRSECRSSVMGHTQRIELAWHPKRNFFALFAGICYTHEEKYMGPQGNSLVPGIWHIRNVKDGFGEPQFISLETLKKEYNY
jgi:hypothetical protein